MGVIRNIFEIHSDSNKPFIFNTKSGQFQTGSIGLGINSGSRVRWFICDNGPEGKIAATPGSMCSDSFNANLYIKKNGKGKYGWKEFKT